MTLGFVTKAHLIHPLCKTSLTVTRENKQPELPLHISYILLILSH